MAKIAKKGKPGKIFSPGKKKFNDVTLNRHKKKVFFLKRNDGKKTSKNFKKHICKFANFPLLKKHEM